MSANFDALLKPPRAQSCDVMVMMTVMLRGEIHGEKEYTGACHRRQEKSNRIETHLFRPGYLQAGIVLLRDVRK
jgi:hypothetical protein